MFNWMQFGESMRRSLTERSRAIAVGGLLTAAAAVHAPTPAEAIWCATYGSGIRSCSFHTQAQCQASISGLGGFCSELPGSQSTSRPAAEPRQKAAPEPRKKPPPNVARQPPPAAASASAAAPAQPAALRQSEFVAARQLILNGKHEAGIAAMRALNQDNHPDVAVYVGLAHRQLGRIGDAKSWYGRALAADANHKLALALNGMLLAEQGDLPGAQAHLIQIGKICGGTECTEYRSLQNVLAGSAR